MSFKRFSQLTLDASNKIDESGFLRTYGDATRVGVFTYLRPDGRVVRELRHPDEVFNADSMASLRNLVITDKHPDGGKVHSKNVKKVQVGYTGNVDKNDPYLRAEITITDEDTIQTIIQGKRELSCGYSCDHDETPGNYNGEAYDLVQRHIRYNHLARVDRGRAGPGAKIRLDSEDAVEFTGDDQKRKLLEEMNMKKITLGGKTFEVDEAAATAIEAEITAEKNKADAAQAKVDAAAAAQKSSEDKLKEQVTKVDQLQATIDASKTSDKETKVDADEVKKIVSKRLELERAAAMALGSGHKIDGMDDKAIKVAVIKSSDKDFDEKDKNDAYIDARFDIARNEAVTKNLKATGAIIIDANNTVDSETRRKAGMEEAKNAWQKPLSLHV